jgi:hypothetical protein
MLSWLELLIMEYETISLWLMATYVTSVMQTVSIQRGFIGSSSSLFSSAARNRCACQSSKLLRLSGKLGGSGG